MNPNNGMAFERKQNFLGLVEIIELVIRFGGLNVSKAFTKFIFSPIHLTFMKRNFLFAVGMIAMSVLLSSCLLKAAAKNASRKGSNDKADKLRMSERTFTAEEINALKNTTTVFVLLGGDEDQREKFVQAIESTWTFTPIRVIAYEDLPNFRGEAYSYFMVQGYNKTVTRTNTADGSSSSTDYFHAYLGLLVMEQVKDKKGRPEIQETAFCREELFIPPGQMGMYLGKNALDELYSKAEFKNWSPGMLKLYLADIQRNLEKNYRAWMYETLANNAELANLANETLYIPEYALVKLGKFTGNEEERDVASSGLLEKYPYKYKVVSTEELSDAILSGEAKYVFDYVRANADQITRVYSVEKGKIYQAYEGGSYNLKAKDFSAIAKLVQK